MAEWLISFFTYMGVYSFLATIWRSYEQIKYGQTFQNNRDTIICLLVSLFITAMLYQMGA